MATREEGTGIITRQARGWRFALALSWPVATLLTGWAAFFGPRTFDAPETLFGLGALLLCTICVVGVWPNPIEAKKRGREKESFPSPDGIANGEASACGRGEGEGKPSPIFLPILFLTTLLLFAIRTYVGPPLLFALPVLAILALILLKQPLGHGEILYAALLALVSGLTGLIGRPITGFPQPVWAALQVALVLPGLLAGWAILRHYGLQAQGAGRVRLLQTGLPSALKSFGLGALLAIPWALGNVAAGSSQGDTWIHAWWQPLTAIQPGIAEEAWGRILLVPLLFVLLRRFARPRAAFTASLIIMAYWFAYLHTPGGSAGLPSTIIIGTLFSLPIYYLCLYRDLETAIGFHFLVDFIRFAAAYILFKG